VSRPGLLGRLGASARVTLVAAPPGSGKTVLLVQALTAAPDLDGWAIAEDLGLRGYLLGLSLGDPRADHCGFFPSLGATSRCTRELRALQRPSPVGRWWLT
jgi:hypothetical protein